MSDTSDKPPIVERDADVETKLADLLDMGAIVYMDDDPLPPGLIGTLSQVLPDGPMMVVVDATEKLDYQAFVLTLALEWITLGCPDGVKWQHVEHVVNGQPRTLRSISIRVQG